MEILHFDTESRKTAVKLTRAELLDLEAEVVSRGSKAGLVTRVVHGANATLTIYVEEGWK